MSQFDKLIEYTNSRLASAGLVLSAHGVEEMYKRFNKKESEGGYSNYWKQL